MPNLALDIGNTRTKLGLFNKNKLVEQAIWTDWTLQELLDFGNRNAVDNLIVSSVAEPDPDVMLGLRDHFQVLELSHDTPLPFHNAYLTPKTLGKDRLASVAGAQALFPEQHCLVVDCGTCIKYELVDAEGTYHGGNIAPGAVMRLKAMHHFTARLPEAPLAMPDEFVGYSTESALQNGALRGAALEIEGFARLFGQKASPLRIILTGGDAAFFLLHLSLPELTHEPNLNLIGLNRILQHNLP